MAKCPSCGGDVAAEVEVCKFCGTRVPPVADENDSEGRPSALEEEVLSLLRARRKIEAIKVYRAEKHCGLKDAKDAVEALAAQHGIAARAGCAGMIALLLLLVAAVLCAATLA